MHSKALRLPPEVVKKVEETRNQFFKYLHEILIQRLVDDVLRVMTDDDRFGLSPTSLERAPIWQDLKTVCNEAADQLAGFAMRTLAPLDAWTEKAEGKRTWQDLYDAKVTRTLVRAYINKVPALRTRI